MHNDGVDFHVPTDPDPSSSSSKESSSSVEEVDLASPTAFQFPSTARSPLSPQQQRNSASHQSSYSLDRTGNGGGRTRKMQGSLARPTLPIARTRSATALPDAALSPDSPSPPLVPPMKPFARRDRSGSDSSSKATPGLKDVLKVYPNLSHKAYDLLFFRYRH